MKVNVQALLFHSKFYKGTFQSIVYCGAGPFHTFVEVFNCF